MNRVTINKKQWRWVGNNPQQRRILFIMQCDQVTIGLFEPALILVDAHPLWGAYRTDRVFAQPECGQCGVRLLKQLTGRLNLVEQCIKSFATDLWCAQQSKPVTLVSGVDGAQGETTISSVCIASSARIMMA